MNQAQNTLIADVRALLKRHKGIGEFLKILGTFLVGAASATVTIRGYLQAKVDSAVNTRLAPYQHVLAGLSLNQGEDYNQAAEALRDSVNSKDLATLPTELRNLFYDTFLLAATNSDEPERFSPEVEHIKSLIGGTVAETGWRKHQVGWYLLRTGKAEEAKLFFLRSRQLYDGEEDRRSGADPARGLLFVSLVDGNVQEAIEKAEELSIRDPKAYARSEFAREIRSWPQEHWFIQMQGYYGQKFQQTIADFSTRFPSTSNPTDSN
jgi:tetratricopeptide (TPR) repeat protein